MTTAAQPRVLIIAGPNGAGLGNFRHHYASRVDAWMLYDNSGLTPTLLDWSE